MGNAGSTCRSEENVKTTKQKNGGKKTKQKTSDGDIEATPVEDVRTSDTVRSTKTCPALL